MKNKKTEYKSFIKKQQAFDEFVAMRKEVLSSIDKNKFADAFADVCSNAMMGNAVAQDLVAHFYNKGVPDLLPINYRKYMSWQVLAGANGNEFALEKLDFFLTNIMDQIVYVEDLMIIAFQKKTITKENAYQMIASLLCESIVDNLQIDPKELVSSPDVVEKFNAKTNRLFDAALKDSFIPVASFLLK